MAALTRYVNTASTVGTQDGTTNTPGSSGTAAFATLKQAIDSLPSTLSDQYTIYCEGTAADTVAIASTPWDMTTSATNYIHIIGEQSPNHPNFSTSTSGKYSTSKYRIEVTDPATGALYNNVPAHLRIEGIQIKLTVTTATSLDGIKLSGANVVAANHDLRCSHCIVWAVESGGGQVTGFSNRPVGSGTGTVKLWNNLAIDCTSGFTCDYTDAQHYNCTAADCDYGFQQADTPTFIVKNCLAKNSAGIGFVGSFSAASDYNAEDDGNGAPGANSRSAQTFTFVNAASDDFHLASGDTGAKNFGVSDPGSGLFSDDVDGGTRSGSWDIGFDEQGVPAAGRTTKNTRSWPLGTEVGMGWRMEGAA